MIRQFQPPVSLSSIKTHCPDIFDGTKSKMCFGQKNRRKDVTVNLPSATSIYLGPHLRFQMPKLLRLLTLLLRMSTIRKLPSLSMTARYYFHYWKNMPPIQFLYFQ